MLWLVDIYLNIFLQVSNILHGWAMNHPHKHYYQHIAYTYTNALK